MSGNNNKSPIDFIKIIGARQHNLKNINLEIPKYINLLLLVGCLAQVNHHLLLIQFTLKVKRNALKVYHLT